MGYRLYFLYFNVACFAVVIKGVLSYSGPSCPPPALLPSVAARTCNASYEYHCLVNGESNLYESFCIKAEKFTAGSYVLYEGWLNSKSCIEDRYQPISYYSNQYYSRCMYSKSRCTEEGQVVHDDSFTEKDTTCRCDYTQGYDFVTKLRNRCFCIPTEEDCSCYKRRCPENTLLTPDYKCLKTVGLVTCPVIKHKESGGGNGVINKHDEFRSTHNPISKNSGFHRFFLVGVILTLVVLLIESIIVILTTELGSPEKNRVSEKFITRNGFKKSVAALAKYRLVVIKGRYGTGKSVMAEQITREFPNYTPLAINENDLIKYVNAKPGRKQIIIFDEVCDEYEDAEGRSNVIKIIEMYFRLSSNLIIINVGEFNNAFIESLRKMALTEDDNFIDLDNEFALSKAEKLYILNDYFDRFVDKYENGSSADSFFLSEEMKEDIASTDTFHGFPLLCKTFHSRQENARIGLKYFKQPPQQLIDEIERIRVDTSATEESPKSSKIQYSILIYILISKEGCVNISDVDSELIREIGGYYFGLGFGNTYLIRYLQMKDNPLQRFL